MAFIGSIALVLALVAAVYSIIAYAISGRRGTASASARFSLIAVCGLVSVSTLVLLLALVTHDFRLEYVASYTSHTLPLPYLISALWAGNDGSLLFWAWLLAVFAAIAMFPKRTAGRELVPYASAIVMAAEVFFIILILATSNPFTELPAAPADGRGLNPLLENIGMVLHPPALLAGYVGLTIPFAFAIAALLLRRQNDAWLGPARTWTLLSWLLLGAGNIIGAWWAYVELGWGGYWAWDPVENAGLMPWLVSTAFFHSIMMQRRRGMFKVWNQALIVLAFNLAIFGTFLTRSGMLSSLHTFGESSMGPFFIGFLFVSFFGPMCLLYLRRRDLKDEAEVGSLASREFTFQLNNLLLIGSVVVIFFGTVFPAISEAVRGVKIEVGKAFFNQVDGPVLLAILLLIGVCTLIGWRVSSNRDLTRNLLWALAAGAVTAAAFFILGIRVWYAIAAFAICSFVLFGVIYQWIRETMARKRTRGENSGRAFWKLLRINRPRYGGYIVHIAMAIMAIGVIGSSAFTTENEAGLKPGQSITVNNYILTYDTISMDESGDKFTVSATVSVASGGKPIGKMTPEMYFHRSYEQPVTEVAIRSTPFEDLYVILAGWDKDGTAALKVVVNPLVSWIWAGGGILAVGGLIAFWPGRKPAEPDEAA
ncbi:MAG: heme lyase CcmF/NrfE family subunit [Chloroflexota bacterium]